MRGSTIVEEELLHCRMKSVRMGFRSAATLIALSCALVQGALAATQEQEIRAVAEQLIDVQAEGDRPSVLENRFLLQLAAGRYAGADETIGALMAERRQSPIPLRAARLVPWRIYARAKQHLSDGLGWDKAVASAFSNTYAALSDAEAAEALARFNVDVDRERRVFEQTLGACGNKALDVCGSADEVVKAWLSADAWAELLPVAGPLVDADLNRRFVIDEDVLVETKDGEQIAVIVTRSRAARLRLTVLLEFTIYADDDVAKISAIRMAAHGYAGAVAYSRGRGRGSGMPVPYKHDGRDATAVIEWLARQAWSDGRVGMYSGSYAAFTQWAAAKHMPPALKAVATSASNAPGIDTPMERNVFQSFFYPWPLYTANGKWLDDETYFDSGRWESLNRKWYSSGKPYRALPEIDGTPNPMFEEWLDHPGYDSYWRAFIPYGKEFAKIDIPVLATTGYFDGGQVGVLYYYRQHKKHNPDADHRLLIGPYHHTAMQTGVFNSIDGYDVDPAAMIDLQGIRLAWFDHVFRGAPLPALLKGEVNFQVMGANRWRHVPSLNDMGEERLRFYLSPNEQGTRYALRDERPGVVTAMTLEVDFADRRDVDYVPPSGACAEEIDTRNALVFESAPLPEAIEVNGPFFGDLDVVVNKRDFDLSIAMYELTAEGRYFPLASFLGRASYIESREKRRLLRPGRRTKLSFATDRLTAKKLAPGSRVVAVIGVPKQPDIQINYGSGRDVSAESIEDAGEPLVIEWLTGSAIELQVTR